MKEFIGFIARALVDHPDSVDISEVVGEKTTVYEMRVAPEDLGKVIGRKGQTAKAIRTLISAVSAKKGKRALLEILE